MKNRQQSSTHTNRAPDCVTEIRMGNSVLVVSGFFKENGSVTATDRMMRALRAESDASPLP